MKNKTQIESHRAMFFCLVIVLLTLFSCSLASAWDWDNVKEFEKGELDYGKITIYNAFNLPLIGSKLAEYTLEDNSDQCLINCYAEGTAKLYDSGQLFSDLNFYNRKRDLRNLKESKILIEVTESYEVDVPKYYEVCEYIEENKTNNCYQEILGSHKETRYKTFWEEYKGEVLEEGDYHWRIEAKKNMEEDIDWIGSAFGERFTEWAWWDGSWDYKKPINISVSSGSTVENYQRRMNITYDSDMNASFKDLRFVNGAENTELDYWIESKVDSAWADVWVEVDQNITTSNYTFYMYYGNQDAESTSNGINTWDFFDDFLGASLNSNHWATDYITFDGSISVGNSIVNITCHGSGGMAIIENKTTLPTQFRIRTEGYKLLIKPRDLGDYDYEPISVLTSNTVMHHHTAQDAGDGYSTLWAEETGATQLYFDTDTSVYALLNSSTETMTVPTFYEQEFRATSTKVEWLINDVVELSAINGTYRSGLYPQFGTYAPEGGTGVMVQIDKVYFGKYYEPEPNYYVGGEEESLEPPIIILHNPTENEKFNISNITFKGIVYDDGGVENVSLILDGVYNETNTSGINNTNYTFIKTVADGNHTWFYEACDEEDNCVNASSRSFSIDIIYPTINLTAPPLIIDYHVLNENLSVNWTVEDEHLDSCWFDYNNTNTTVTCGDNHTEFVGIAQTNLTFYANDTYGNLNSSFREWGYKVLENLRTYNTTSYETDSETFVLNISSTGLETMTADLYYDGVSYATTKTGNNYEMNFTTTLDVPKGVENNTFYWQVHYGVEHINTNSNNQTISAINLTYCTTGVEYDYLNFKYRNEADDSFMNATIDASTFDYWLGSGDVKHTLLYSNTTVNISSHGFCFTPSDRTLNVDFSIQYSYDGFPQRRWENASIFTNSTPSIALYLLSSTDGIYTTFQVLSSANQPIKGVYATATRIITGSPTLIGAGTTGDDGGVTFWVNPDYLHTFLFTKTGYDDVSLSITPTQSAYTIYMGGEEFNESYDFSRGIFYSIAPELYELINDTYYVFNFTISSSYWSLTDYGFTLIGQNGTSLGNNSSSVETGSSVTLNVSTLNYTWVRMNYYWNINGNYSNGTRTWGIEQDDYGYGLKTFFAHLKSYTEQEIFGLNEWSRTLIIFILIFIAIGMMSYASGLYSPAAISVELFVLIAFFDVVTELLPSPVGAVAHFPTIITGLVMIVLLIREALK